MVDPYDVLGVSAGATDEEIRAAWRRRAFDTHPDRGGGGGAFRRVQEAYDVLRDPGRRQLHDLRRAGFGGARVEALFAAAFGVLFEEAARSGLDALVGRALRVEAGGVRVTIRIGVGWGEPVAG